MKFYLAIFLLAALAVAQTDSAPPSQSIPVDQENARRARAVLDRTIQALGGQAYLNIQDITQAGRTYSFYHGRPNSLGILFWRFYRFPDRDRIELTKQRDVIYVYQGDKGYEITFKGAHPQDPKDLAEYSAETPLLPRLGAEKMAVGTGSSTILRRPHRGRRKARRASHGHERAQ